MNDEQLTKLGLIKPNTNGINYSQLGNYGLQFNNNTGFNYNPIQDNGVLNTGFFKGTDYDSTFKSLYESGSEGFKGMANHIGFNADGLRAGIENKLFTLKDFQDGKVTGDMLTKAQAMAGNGSGSLFGWGSNKEGQTTFGGATGLQWLSAGLGTANTLFGMYNSHKSMKLAKQNFEEQKALSHANYQMQAKAYNNNLRNQQSGRSYTGASGLAKRTLGREYDSRKAMDDY